MTRSSGRRSTTVAGALAGAVVLAVTAFAGFDAPAGAAATNPCKVLKKSEIQQVFGATVSSGRKGFSTAATTQCEFSVAANAFRPAGTLIVHVMTTRAKSAYHRLQQQPTRFAAVDGEPNALYSDTSHVVNLLKGDTLVGVKAGFTITEPLPVHSYDDKAQLIQLARLAANRV